MVAANLGSISKYRHQVSVATEKGNGSVLNPECANSHSVVSGMYLFRRLAGFRDSYHMACTPREQPRIMVSLSEKLPFADPGVDTVA
jgi:hypothetical protein